MFNSLRLLSVVTIEVLVDILAEILVKLETWVEIWQPEELKVFNSLRLSIVLLLAVCYWDSLKS